MSQKDLSIYIHIPFCVSKCDYCDFFSISHPEVPREYLDALKSQFRFYRDFYGVGKASTVYVGGGTPSLLDPGQIQYLFESLRSTFDIDPLGEVTFEANPESLTLQKVEALRNSGVNRLSLGVQSLSQECLRAVHRKTSVPDIEETLEMLGNAWKGGLSLDVIAGLPESTERDFMETLEKVVEYGPDHVSMYSLTIEEETPLGKRLENGWEYDIDLWDGLWIQGRRFLEERGYRQYEVSNFCRNGKFSRHNKSYWDQKDYLGFGSGATGTVYDFSSGRFLRQTGSRDIGGFCRYWNGNGPRELENPFMETEMLSLEEVEFEFLMMGLRKTEGVSALEYRKRFGSLGPWYGDIEKRLGAGAGLWKQWEERGLAARTAFGGQVFYSLTSEGILFLNTLLLEL